ncbi:MAG: hypothetical protein NVSMB25_21110 [Thermoleophilaceae bacterium]
MRLSDALIYPDGRLPRVSDTDTLSSFESWLVRSPALNRAAVRVLLLALELSPLAGPDRAPLRALGPARSGAWLASLERSRAGLPVRLLKRMSQLSYYGSDGVMRALGYDAAANVERGRALRERDGRP